MNNSGKWLHVGTNALFRVFFGFGPGNIIYELFFQKWRENGIRNTNNNKGDLIPEKKRKVYDRYLSNLPTNSPTTKIKQDTIKLIYWVYTILEEKQVFYMSYCTIHLLPNNLAPREHLQHWPANKYKKNILS